MLGVAPFPLSRVPCGAHGLRPSGREEEGGKGFEWPAQGGPGRTSGEGRSVCGAFVGQQRAQRALGRMAVGAAQRLAT